MELDQTTTDNKKKHVGCIIAIVALGVLLLGAVGYIICEKTIWKQKCEVEYGNGGEGDNGEDTSSGVVGDESPSYAFFAVERWGVKFRIPDGLFDIVSYPLQASGDGEEFSANGYSPHYDVANGGEICSMGMLMRFSDNTTYPVYTEEDKTNAVKVGDYYFLYSTSWDPCDDTTGITLMKQMLSNPEPMQ